MPTKSSRRKYGHLLQDQDLKRWYDNTARGSQITADVYLRHLGSFCNNRETTPNALLQMEDNQIQDTLLDYVTWAETQGHAGSYIHSTIKATRSWLTHNRRDTKTRIKIKGRNDTPTLRNEKVPTPTELKKILLSADKKTRTACLLIAHSGLRTGVLGNYRGTDGLRLKDLPETTNNNGTIQYTKTPTIITVRKELSKAGHQYITFLGTEGCNHLKEYLEERARQGEQLGPETSIIKPKTGNKQFITSIKIGEAIRAAIRKAGLQTRPYVLRAYFDTQLLLAESRGQLIRDYRQFWMGHKGDIENHYTTNKERLTETMIEDMRQRYKQSTEYLETEAPRTSQEQIRDQFRHQLLLVAGFKEEEINAQNLNQTSDEEFQDIVRKRLLGQMINNGATQKIVNLEEVEKHVANGWEYVDTLPNGKAILKLPK